MIKNQHIKKMRNSNSVCNRSILNFRIRCFAFDNNLYLPKEVEIVVIYISSELSETTTIYKNKFFFRDMNSRAYFIFK